MVSHRRSLLAWFSIGLCLPPTLYGLSALAPMLGIPSVGSAIELLALGSCPFWLFLWLPAMSQPDNRLLFSSSIAAVLIANGCLYLLMAFVQNKTRDWRRSFRWIALSTAYPLLMALGYCFPLGLEALLEVTGA